MGVRRLNVFDEDAWLVEGRRKLTMISSVPWTAFCSSMQPAVGFHFFTDAFDVVDFKGDVGDAAAAAVELVRTPECGMIISIGLA